MDTQSARENQELIARCFTLFNERRLEDAASLFASDALVEQVGDKRFDRGGPGYLQLASVWLNAFPDATMTVGRIVPRDGTTFEVDVNATGTHRGALDLGSLIFRPTNSFSVVPFRTLVQVRDGLITYCSISFDIQAMVEQLVVVDRARVLEHVQRICKEGERLVAARGDQARSREVLQRLGFEIDAARQAVRPYFKR